MSKYVFSFRDSRRFLLVRLSGSLSSYILLLYLYRSSTNDSLVVAALQEVIELEYMKLFLDFLLEVVSKTCSDFAFIQLRHSVNLVLLRYHKLQFYSR